VSAAVEEGITVLDVLRRHKGGKAISGNLHNSLVEGTTLLVTKYNRMIYMYQEVASNMFVHSPFPRDRDGEIPDVATFAEYYAQRWGLSGEDLDSEQPLLRAVRVSEGQMRSINALRAALMAAEKDELFLVPQLCSLHPIPVELWAALYAAPQQMWRIEGGLVARDLLAHLVASGLPSHCLPAVSYVRRAITAPSALDSRGDYETLEAVGDGFLKYAVSTELFLRHPGYHEGQLTSTKDRLVSNARLIRVALRLGMDRRVRVKSFAETEDSAEKIDRRVGFCRDVFLSVPRQHSRQQKICIHS